MDMTILKCNKCNQEVEDITETKYFCRTCKKYRKPSEVTEFIDMKVTNEQVHPSQDEIEELMEMYRSTTSGFYADKEHCAKAHSIFNSLYLGYFEMKELWLNVWRELNDLKEQNNE